MPRAPPKDRPEEVPMRFTSFWIPPPMNSKNAASNYLKTDSQTMWARNTANGTAGGKRKRTPVEDSTAGTSAPDTETKRGSDVIIIHPGTRFLRVGRATDAYPISVHHVIARKSRVPVSPPHFVRAIPPFNPMRTPATIIPPPEGVEPLPHDYEVLADPEDPVDLRVASIRTSLRIRMKTFGFGSMRDGSSRAAEYNRTVKPLKIPDHQDQSSVEWLRENEEEDTIVGSKVFRIPDPVKSQYTVRWPIRGSKFNQSDYASRQELLGDVQTIWTSVLRSELGLEPRNYKNHSVILVVPDYWEKFYVRELVNLLLVQMGFRRISIQQESICASFGASLAAATVVDIGAGKTSVSCIEEGLVLPDTRLSLSYGGDDISELFFRLLERIELPYRTADLSRSYDWNMIEDLKSRSATLAEVVDVDLIAYELFVRAPGRPAEKYTIKTYDEPNIASMVLFEPGIIDFENKRAATSIWASDYIDEMEVLSDSITQAMIASTAHLNPDMEPAPKPAPAAAEPTATGENNLSVPTTDEASGATESKPPTRAGSASDQRPETSNGNGSTSVHIYPGGARIDIRYEASKIPLDHAIFHSVRASATGAGAGANERLKKMLACILVVGGTALTPGMLHALESRVKGLVAANLPGLEDLVAVIPAPKEIDPRVLAWKGVAVLSKLDSLSDLWIQQADWDMMGMRALKERSFFL